MEDIRNIPIFISHYYMLTERKEYLDKALKQEGFTDIRWIQDITRDNMTPDQLALYKYDPDRWNYLNSVWSAQAEPRKLSGPEIANHLTHLKIYKTVVDQGLDIALVLEDDCILHESFKNKLNAIVDQLPLKFDTCFLSDAFGWNISNYKSGFFGLRNKNVKTDDKLIYPMSCSKTADAYLISKKGAKQMYDAAIPFCLPIDWTMNPIFVLNNFVNFWADPAIVSQGSFDIYKSSAMRPGSSVPVSYVVVEDSEDDEIPLEKIIKYSQIEGEFQSNKYFNLKEKAKERIEELIDKLKNNKHFYHIRQGDGETRNMIANDEKQHNCDGCFYYKDMGLDLIKAYIYSLKNENAYIHKWHSHTYNIIDRIDNDYRFCYDPEKKFLFFDLLVHKLVPATPATEKYAIDGVSFKEEQIRFFRTIKESKRTKIYISHEAMIKAVGPLLNLNIGITIPATNCYLQKKEILNSIRTQLNDKQDCIVLFSCGMASKVFMTELFKERPNHTYIDIGSSFDGLIRHSRDFNGSKLYKDVLIKCYAS